MKVNQPYFQAGPLSEVEHSHHLRPHRTRAKPASQTDPRKGLNLYIPFSGSYSSRRKSLSFYFFDRVLKLINLNQQTFLHSKYRLSTKDNISSYKIDVFLNLKQRSSFGELAFHQKACFFALRNAFHYKELFPLLGTASTRRNSFNLMKQLPQWFLVKRISSSKRSGFPLQGIDFSIKNGFY